MTLNGSSFAAVKKNKELVLWDLRNKKPKALLIGHMSKIISVAASPDSSRILTGDMNNIIKVWDAHTGEELDSFNLGKPNETSDKVFMPISFDTQYFVYYYGELTVWSIKEN